jgi:rubrerythrin
MRSAGGVDAGINRKEKQMMWRKSWVLAAVALVAFAAGLAVPRTQALHRKTLENLHTAMHGEAFAYASYMLYAEQARKAGHPEIADMFENAAKTERFEHFAEEAELAGLVGTTEENLRTAIKGETYESTTMYKDFADEASSVEDHDAAERFEEIRRDEMKHRAMFESALQKLEKTSEGHN